MESSSFFPYSFLVFLLGIYYHLSTIPEKLLSSFLINKNRSITQAALQFILSHPQVSVVIPGTRKITNLEENVKALESPDLTDEELEKIRSISEEIPVQI